MTNFCAPSFSLGIDSDIDIDDIHNDREEQQHRETATATNPPVIDDPSFELFRGQEIEERCDFEPDFEVEARDAEQILDFDCPALKRLRRGPPSPPLCRTSSPLHDVGNGVDGEGTPFGIVDEDIEDFSSQEEAQWSDVVDKYSSARSHACSNSKFSLAKKGVVTSQSTTKLKASKWTPASNASTSSVLTESNGKKLFPKLTISPVRKIYLLDSDSDDPFSQDDAEIKRKLPSSMPKMGHDKKIGFNQPQENLWKNFSPKKANVPTPFLDEFCEEYFNSMKKPEAQYRKDHTTFCSSKVLNTSASTDNFEVCCQEQSIFEKPQHYWSSSTSQPPAYKYFCHNDVKVQSLVRERLCHIVPLGLENHGAEPVGQSLNYMSQFNNNNRDARCQSHKTCLGNMEGTSGKGKSRDATANWINPRSSTGVTKDVGKRRVHASGHQSGHWFTAEGGAKVYVSKGGQELTGKMAYLQYRRDNGSGFHKTRKKAAPKKKPVAKKRK